LSKNRNNFERFEKVNAKIRTTSIIYVEEMEFVDTPVPRIVWTICNSRV